MISSKQMAPSTMGHQDASGLVGGNCVLDVGCGDDCKIRRLSLVQGKSIKAICRELKICRKVVRKVLRSEETESRYECKHQPCPRIGAWRDELDRLPSANSAKS